MKEYIEKQQAIDAAREDGKKIPTLAIRIMHDIKAIPAADVVPVVRCKDCIYQTESWSGIKYCEAHGDHIGKDYDYCSNARRRGEQK